jgi:hypothetical protein
MHVGKEIVPVGVYDCGRCSGGLVSRTAVVLLSTCAFHAFLTFLFFVTTPAHMMLAPIESAILDFLLV